MRLKRLINKGKLLVSARKKIALVLAILLLNSCVTNASSEPSQPWRVSVTMPSFYPVNVTQVYGVNNKEDCTVLLHGYLHTMRNSELDRVRKSFSDYDGFGLSLVNGTIGT